MSDEEFVIAIVSILSIFIGMPFIVVRGILSFQRQKGGRNAGSAVGMGELEAHIEQAVARAGAPVVDRLERVEDQLERLAAAATLKLPEAEALEIDAPSVEKTVGRKIAG